MPPGIRPEKKPQASRADKAKALGRSVLFYGLWYPSRWLGWSAWPRFRQHGALATHLRFVERSSRRLAREIFHALVVYRGRLQQKQALLFRVVDVANELFAMAAAVARVRALVGQNRSEANSARRLADLFCRNARRRVQRRIDRSLGR